MSLCALICFPPAFLTLKQPAAVSHGGTLIESIGPADWLSYLPSWKHLPRPACCLPADLQPRRKRRRVRRKSGTGLTAGELLSVN